MNSMWSALLRPTQPKPERTGRQPPPVQPTKYVVGDTVGEWTLLEYRPGRAKPRLVPRWLCRCSCGVERWVLGSNLLSGQSKSCGHTKRQGYRAVTLNGGDIRYPVSTMTGAKKGTGC